MNNPELYHRSNVAQKRDAQQCLEDYSKKITWKKDGATVIDIGCGDGHVTTSILKGFIPDCKALIGCDISEKMIQFANAHHATDSVNFKVLDIESDLPDQLCGKFDHAFSFSALHWVKQQEIAFSNIYKLLAKKGECLLMFVGYSSLYYVYHELARSSRWKYWLRDVDLFVSPYHDCKDPENNIKTMMTTIGFTKVEVKNLQKTFVYNGIENFKNSMNAINPFKIPLELQKYFFKDLIELYHNKGLIDHVVSKVDDQFNVNLNYNIIIVNGKK